MNTFGLNTVVLTALALTFGCIGSKDSEDSSPVATHSGTDITNVVLTRTSGDCNDYEGEYTSTVNDTKRSQSFTGSVSISVGTSSCSVSSNSIPNHDFNDGSSSFANEVKSISCEMK